MQTIEEQKYYKWEYKDVFKEWFLNLFQDGNHTVYSPEILSKIKGLLTGKRELVLPFTTRKKNQNIAPHLITLKQFKPLKLTNLKNHNYGFKPRYKGKVDSQFLLMYADWINYENKAEAYFLNGEFKTGRMPMRFWYTEDLQEFKEDLTCYFKSTQRFGLPPFGEYLKTFFTNSNLPKEVTASFRELME
ncbi:hypothetical protein DRN69_03140 [Candidatus Pacearchaeota archaeon]|nr:MAG: hypothetical protein DRN69_03140 [Candidatus Pacearchaeota archaeon]